MAETAVAIPHDRRLRVWRRQAPPGGAGRSYWQVAWSGLAAARALRVTVVAPGLLALCLEVIGNPQMALYATFGAFATLVMASFGGSRRDKAVAHLGLAVVGSVALTIGTLVSGTTWLAALVTVAAGFAIFFGSSVTGRNAAAGVTAALIAYLLPVVNAGTASEIPARLAGWWLASPVGTAAVLLVSPASPGDSLRSAAGASARALASQLAAAARGEAIPARVAAGHELLNRFEATPYRPTGLAITDQALAGVVHQRRRRHHRGQLDRGRRSARQPYGLQGPRRGRDRRHRGRHRQRRLPRDRHPRPRSADHAG